MMIDRPEAPPDASGSAPSREPSLCPHCDRNVTRPRRPLTPAQERVAQLLARGLTSRQIAGALEISRRTVQMHVNHIAAKLPTDELTPERRVMVWAFWEYRAT